MLAALWQGELIAALGAVGEDEDFRSLVPETNRRESHRSSCGMAERKLMRFLKSFLRRCFERRGALKTTAEGSS
jgi:hypothetical protein